MAMMERDADEMVFESASGQSGLPAWFKPVFEVARRAEIGALVIELPDGRRFRAAGAEHGPTGRIVVENPRAFRRMALGGNMGFAESYLDGDWRTPDLQAVLDMVILNNARVARGLRPRAVNTLVERLRHWMRRNTRSQARKNVEAHYDLGNAFYALWLDASMTYSSALFDQEGLSLGAAQARKYGSICARMALRPDEHVLELGCGWGGFAEFAAKERGARVTGLTISPSQLDYARKRIFEAGLAERVSFVLRDYRDERGTYDRVASIEMFEAVGEKYWPTYFQTVRDRLRAGGRAALQIITIDDDLFVDYRRGVDFIQKYIFPGGMLPSVAALRDEATRAGLGWIDHIAFSESYSRTLRLWLERFETAWPEIERLQTDKRGFDERFRRMWRFYLAVCAACFRARTTDVLQVSLGRA